MKKLITGMALFLTVLVWSPAQEKGPVDVILLMDTSSALSGSFQELQDYITGPFLREFLRVGDTFHLISIADTPRREIARLVEGVGDVETIISRLFLMYPLEPDADLPAALEFTGQYVSTLPDMRRKIVVLITSKDRPAQTEAAARLNGARTDFHLVQFPLNGNGPLSGRSGVRKSATQIAQAAPPARTAPAAETALTAPPVPAPVPEDTRNVQPEAAPAAQEALVQAEPDSQARRNAPAPARTGQTRTSTQPKTTQPKTNGTRTASNTKNQTVKQTPPETAPASEPAGQPVQNSGDAPDNRRIQAPAAQIAAQEPVPEGAAVLPQTRSALTESAQSVAEVPPEARGVQPQPSQVTVNQQRSQPPAPVQPQTAQTVVTSFLTRSSQVRGAPARAEPPAQPPQVRQAVSPELAGMAVQPPPPIPENAQPAVQPVQTAAAQSQTVHTRSIRQAEFPEQVRISRRIEPSPQPVRPAAQASRAFPSADKPLAAVPNAPSQTAHKEAEQKASSEQAEAIDIASIKEDVESAAPMAIFPVKAFELLPGPALGDPVSLLSPFCMALGLSMAVSMGFLVFRSGRQMRSFPNKTMAYVVGGALSSKAESRSAYPLTEYAAKQQQRSLAVHAGAGKPGAGLLMLSLFVEDQNAAAGRRNVHAIKPGYSYTIGGGNSDFLIFLLPLPPYIAEIYSNEDGSCTFIPKKPRFFPDLGSNALPDCIGKTIRIVSGKNYELFIRLERYEDPLKSLDWLLQAIKPPHRRMVKG